MGSCNLFIALIFTADKKTRFDTEANGLLSPYLLCLVGLKNNLTACWPSCDRVLEFLAPLGKNKEPLV